MSIDINSLTDVEVEDLLANPPEDLSIDDKKKLLARLNGNEIDPLREIEEQMIQFGFDAFDMFIDEILLPRDTKEKSIVPYRTTYRQWREFMEEQGRHPACPAPSHVNQFVEREKEKGNSLRTIRKKLSHLNQAFEYWQNDAAFDHSTAYNPFSTIQKKMWAKQVDEPEFPPFSMEDIAETVNEVKHVRDRAIIMTQLKLGLRSGELCNIKLSEINLYRDKDEDPLKEHYPEMGTHRQVRDRPFSVYIPSDRDGNKSRRDKVLPIDDELRAALVQYLYLRPDNGQPWVFLSNNSGLQMIPNNINDRWRKYWHPKWAGTDEYRGVVAHFGRHVFTTYFRSINPIEHEWVKYLRGDITSDLPGTGHKAEAIERYIHTKYEDVEPVYRAEIFKFSDYW